MGCEIIHGDITEIIADAIVDPAESDPIYIDGTDASIYHAAGAEQLSEARKGIGVIENGEVGVTPAFALDAKYIFHTVVPSWTGGREGELEALASCYINCLEMAETLQCTSIAFPLLATGVSGFPKDEALEICTAILGDFIISSDITVFLVIYDQKNVALPEWQKYAIDTYLDAHYTGYDQRALTQGQAATPYDLETSGVQFNRSNVKNKKEKRGDISEINAALDDMNGKETFSECLFRLMRERNVKKNSTVYRGAGISKSTFSDIIKTPPGFVPGKRILYALGISLKASLEEVTELLTTCDHAFLPTDRFDVIMKSIFTTRCYRNLLEVNIILYDYGEEPFKMDEGYLPI